MSSHANAKRYFVTATHPLSVIDLITRELGTVCDAHIVLKSGGVWLEKTRMTDPLFKLNQGQTLRVYISTQQNRIYTLLPQDIVFEDEHLIVVNKPSKVSTVTTRSDQFYNLTYGVNQYLKTQGIEVNYSPITRLDYRVSGLTLFAKTAQAVKTLSLYIQTGKIFKLYEATLRPFEAPPSCLRIQNKLEYSGRTVESETGKWAKSLFILNRFSGKNPVYSVIIFTGKRHQIRSHAAQFLSPILQDDLYGPYTQNNRPLGLRAVGLNFFAFGKRYRIRLQA
jgi:23S rRNA pseudouridine1911/1915/1917 synthase